VALCAQSPVEQGVQKQIDSWNERAHASHTKNLDTTIFYAQKALALAQKKAYRAGEIEALRLLGTGYDLKGDLGKANEVLERAMQLAEKQGDKILLAKVYNNLGNLYFKKNTEVGLQYFLKSLALRRQVGDKKAISSSLLNIGSMYLRLKDTQNALQYYEESLQIKQELKDARGIGLLLGNIASVYKEKKDLPKAQEYAQKAIAQHRHIKDESGETYSLHLLGDIAIEEKRYADALPHFQRAYEIAQKVKAKQQMATACDRLHKIYASMQNFEKAYEYSLAYKKISDSLVNESTIKQITQLEDKIKYEEKENILKNAQAKNLATQRFYTYTIGIGLFFVSFVAYIIFRSRQAQQKANATLTKQNAEIQNQTEELRQMNEELDNQARQLSTLNHTKDKIFAIVGHDLKSPINSLKGLLSLVTSQNISPDEFVQFTSQLQQNVEHIHFTMNNLLHWANAQMQGIETAPKNTDLYELAQENIDLFESVAQNKQITLQNSILPTTIVWADTDQINLVFRNLISNALKFTPKGGKISLKQENGNDFYQISVTDTGIGISKEVQAKLFQPQIHLSTQGTAGEKGTGLGLLLCKDFVENNRGKIWVESTPNQGTTFYFTLPHP
jgi:signal transduction histidine kinase/uncharacterized protein HemY